MPIYEYKCQKCDHEFEFLVLGSGASSIECPECNSEKVEKLMSTFGFKSSGSFTSSGSDAGCSGCTSTNCSNCK